jgi:hypothetical protein
MLPVAAAPMIAPVAAPHAAPWPTGVSQELSKRQITEMHETIVKTFVFIDFGNKLINRPRTEWLRSKSARLRRHARPVCA